MYELHYGLKEKPFSLLPDPDFLFLSSKHSLALSILEYSLAGQAGFCAITGEIGSGKTTLIRALLRRVGRETTIGVISNTHSGLTDVTSRALEAFGRDSSGGPDGSIYRDLMYFLVDEYGAGRRCVLIVDEAQNLTIEALEELRLLSNINSEKDLLLQVILVGQPELLEKLRKPELCQLAQRISISYHLSPLTISEARRYVRHRLEVAGASQPIFTDMAIAAVQYYTNGVPRLINSICDLALVYGLAEGRTGIDLDIVSRVISDRLATGIAPLAKSGKPDDPEVMAEIAALAREAGATQPKPEAMVRPETANDASEPELPLAEHPDTAASTAANGHATAGQYPRLEVPRAGQVVSFQPVPADASAGNGIQHRMTRDDATGPTRPSLFGWAFKRTS